VQRLACCLPNPLLAGAQASKVLCRQRHNVLQSTYNVPSSGRKAWVDGIPFRHTTQHNTTRTSNNSNWMRPTVHGTTQHSHKQCVSTHASARGALGWYHLHAIQC